MGPERILIYLGIVIMAYSIWRYARFARHMRTSQGDWKKEQRIFNIPMILLLLFLAGYIFIAVFGRPDLVVSFILFGGSIFVLVMQILIGQIADRIRESERLEARARAAETANEAKSAFLSNMSHDIRTPLNAIIGYTTLAKRAPLEHQPEYIHKIENAGHQMLTLVNEVLEMSRIEKGGFELEPENADLEAVVLGAGDLVRTQMEEKGIQFSVQSEIENRWVVCDANRLNRVLMNMLSNACKFTESGGEVCLSVRETDGREELFSEYEFKVRDTGIGMSQDFIDKVFSPFERERTSTVSRIQGTGLGMAISKNIVDLMGGEIKVESEPGQGTEFTVRVSLPKGEAPVERETSEQATAKTYDEDIPFGEDPDAEEENPSVFRGMRLLLAEDQEVNREIATLLLEQEGFDVDTVSNGQDAVDRLVEAGPGVYTAVLMDIQMPVLDGYGAARRIRSLGDPGLAGIPIIAMTANAFKEDEKLAAEAGMQGHIAKPIDVNVMMETLKRVLLKDSDDTGRADAG